MANNDDLMFSKSENSVSDNTGQSKKLRNGKSDFEKNQHHWISELFPVKYKSNEFFHYKVEGDKNNDRYSSKIEKDNVKNQENNNLKKFNFEMANSFYSNIYSKVVAAEVHFQSNESLVDDGDSTEMTHNGTMNDSVSNVVVADERVDITYPPPQTQQVPKERIEDIKTIREAYKKMKEKSLWLLCVLESRNVKIDELKMKNSKVIKENKSLQIENTGLKRCVLRLESENTVYVQSNTNIEKKLSFYEDCNNALSETVQKLEKELNLATKIHQETLKKLSQTVREHKNAFSEFKKDRDNYLRRVAKDYELRNEDLEKKLSETESNLSAKTNECKTFSKQLEHLNTFYLQHDVADAEKHYGGFMDGDEIAHLDGLEKCGKKQFLDVADI